MCNFWSCVLTREGKVLWSKKTSSHEEIIKENNLKDNKLIDRDFVRLEVHPKNKMDLFSKNAKNWEFKIDEAGTLPEWFSLEQKHWEEIVWTSWKKALKKSLWKLPLKPVLNFIKSIPKVKFFSMKGKVSASWKMFYGETWSAACGAACNAAYGATSVAASVAAYGAASVAASSAASDAACVAACVAAYDAAYDAAHDAAYDAGLLASCLLVKDKIAKKHFNHAVARWKVWQAGYGLRCDVNGKLYVYAVKKTMKKKRKR